MKRFKILVVTSVLFVLSSLGLAQSEGFGVYSGWPEWLGIQYQSSSLRFGGGISFLGLGASADLIIGENQLPVTGGNELSWYFGAGAGAGFWAFLGGGFYVFPHGLIGIEYKLAGTTYSFYGEAQVGASIVFAGGGTAIGPDFATRVGVIFR
ncbi:hypothetical protein [Calidithermus roseus]|uniref:Outer membrane protein beta-barrel domain protein n=1 Tax=Calidithermus roseus TaxID=1644118 RepID=A0A399EZF8_9DEIN|nr:hypothetical protein [Calidithermus roseus]RIH89143.1 hypothetical protein Mrose_00528 [Calidithermus roseus]